MFQSHLDIRTWSKFRSVSTSEVWLRVNAIGLLECFTKRSRVLNPKFVCIICGGVDFLPILALTLRSILSIINLKSLNSLKKQKTLWRLFM